MLPGGHRTSQTWMDMRTRILFRWLCSVTSARGVVSFAFAIVIPCCGCLIPSLLVSFVCFSPRARGHVVLAWTHRTGRAHRKAGQTGRGDWSVHSQVDGPHSQHTKTPPPPPLPPCAFPLQCRYDYSLAAVNIVGILIEQKPLFFALNC